MRRHPRVRQYGINHLVWAAALAVTERPPEETIRRWLAEHGPVDVGIEAIEQTWKLERLTAGDRRQIGRALEGAGVICEPPLRRAGRGDRLQLSLAPEARVQPQPEPEPKSRPRGEAEPAARSEPEPEPQPEATARAEPEPEAPATPGPPTRPQGEPAAGRPAELKLAPLALALMVVGALGPWAKNIFVVDYGLDRSGLVVIALAATAGLLLAFHARAGGRTPLPLAAALLATVSVMVVVADFRELLDDDVVGPAWGLFAAFAGSAATVAISMLSLARR